MTLTPHFTLEELACHDGTPVPMGLYFNALRVATAAEAVRKLWGLPLVVTSGYRTPFYNVECGGAPESFHVWALALDLQPPGGVSVADFWTAICTLAPTTTIRGIGYADATHGNFVHIDCRPSAVLRQWTYPLRTGSQP